MNAPRQHPGSSPTSPEQKRSGVSSVSVVEQINEIIKKSQFILEGDVFDGKNIEFNFSQLSDNVNISMLFKYLVFKYLQQGFYIEGLISSQIDSKNEDFLETIFFQKVFKRHISSQGENIHWILKKTQHDFIKPAIIQKNGKHFVTMNFVRDIKPPKSLYSLDEILGYLISGVGTEKRRIISGFDKYGLDVLVKYLNHEISKTDFENMLKNDKNLSNISLSGNRLSILVASDKLPEKGSGYELDFVKPKNSQNLIEYTNGSEISHVVGVKKGDFLGYIKEPQGGISGRDIFGKTLDAIEGKKDVSDLVSQDFVVKKQGENYQIFADKSGVVTIRYEKDQPYMSIKKVFSPIIQKILEFVNIEYEYVSFQEELHGKKIQLHGTSIDFLQAVTSSQVFIPHGIKTDLTFHETLQNSIIIHLGTGKINITEILPNCLIYAPNCLITSDVIQHNAQLVCRELHVGKMQGVKMVYSNEIIGNVLVNLGTPGLFVGENISFEDIVLQGSSEVILVRENKQTQEFIDEINGKIAAVDDNIKKAQQGGKKVQNDLKENPEYKAYEKLRKMRTLFLTPEDNLSTEDKKLFGEVQKKFTLLKVEALMSQKKFIIQNSLDNLAEYKKKIIELQEDKSRLEKMLEKQSGVVSVRNISTKGEGGNVLHKKIDTHFFAENNNLTEKQARAICEDIFQYFIGKSIPADITKDSGSIIVEY